MSSKDATALLGKCTSAFLIKKNPKMVMLVVHASVLEKLFLSYT